MGQGIQTKKRVDLGPAAPKAVIAPMAVTAPMAIIAMMAIIALMGVTALMAVTAMMGVTFALPGRSASGEEAAPIDGKVILKQLANVSLDPQNTFKVKEVNIDRDALHITLHRGTLAFFTPVLGHVTGAVFIGNGEILVIPPDKIERFQLNKFADSPVLTESFTSAVFRFTDGTFDQIVKSVNPANRPEPEGLSLMNAWDEAVRALSQNLNYRILQDLLSTHPRPFFQASINGIEHGWYEAVDDHRAFEPILLGQVKREGGASYPDIWCSFQPKTSDLTDRPHEADSPELYDILSVDIDAEIAPDTHLKATARLNLNLLISGERLIPFELARGLKVSSVIDGQGRALSFFQNTLLEADEVARRGNDLVYVLLDQPTQKGQPMSLVFKYSGDVISDLGDGIYFVGARGTWYPNHGLSDMADYHLTFHYPANMTLVATGSLLRETTAGVVKVSEWESGGPIGVAGFNYGDYLTKSQVLNHVDVEVFANRGLETIVNRLQMRLDQLQAARLAAMQQAQGRAQPQVPSFDLNTLPPLNTQTMLSNVIDDTSSSLDFLESWFGPYPYRKLAVSQIPGYSGQGWPSLCYVSTLTFLNPQQQRVLGVSEANQFIYSRIMRAHEIAHQWWGNLITPLSYHDTWLMEGMANYAAYVYAASKDPRDKDFLNEMRLLKEQLEEKTKDGATVESAGPIWLGWRLYSSKTPTGYQRIVYDKGAWVMHMLRMMMRDPRRAEPDERFVGAVKSFLLRYKDQAVSTGDFKRALEQHMTPSMDLDGNHNLDWFFDEWVYDVGIPEYALHYTIGGSPAKGFHVSGRVEQTGVPNFFEMPVPVFAHYGNRAVLIGHVNTSGHETRFFIHLPESRIRPTRITLNDNGAVLCDLKSK